jgi:hypothetical protein
MRSVCCIDEDELALIRSRYTKIEPWVFVAFAAACTILSARSFFGAREVALRFAEASRQALPSDNPATLVPPVSWSAPLDDVFIHFDFARSLARGRFFEWAPGGGYSSGATSWLYPAILAVAYRGGLTGFALGRFSDWFSCLCVFGGLWALRRAYHGWSRFAPYLMTGALMSLGVFGWALWSGMELPLFFALWCCGQAVFRDLQSGESTLALEVPRGASFRTAQSLRRSSAWLLGILGLLLSATRPEGLICLGIWWVFAARDSGLPSRLRAFGTLAVPLLGPALLLLSVRGVLNRVYTGEFADAGSIVKLEPLAPFYDTLEILRLWVSNLGFQLGRITAYHAGDNAYCGSLLWLLVCGALVLQKTRRDAQLLCSMAFFWIGLVANNEYVRYQNDRYTMPPLAWLVITATLFVVGLAEKSFEQRGKPRPAVTRLLPVAISLGAVGWWTYHQIPRFRQQNWLFGRACRNIAEQQIRLGLLLRSTADTPKHRILVGDAGAIQYFSDLPGVDAVGLGGTRGLPFARAVRLGNGATVELIEHLSAKYRPDTLALYPSWWKDLPLWFGRRLFELDISGNVICGASNKVVYAANWRGFDADSGPSFLEPGWHVVDELDVADLVSESAHGYRLFERHSGYVFMKILPHPRDPSRDLFDAGRILFGGNRARFQFSHLKQGHPMRVVVRAAPVATMHCRARLDGRDVGQFNLPPNDAWQESSLEVNRNLVQREAELEIVSEQGECNLFHIWALQPDI